MGNGMDFGEMVEKGQIIKASYSCLLDVSVSVEMRNS